MVKFGRLVRSCCKCGKNVEFAFSDGCVCGGVVGCWLVFCNVRDIRNIYIYIYTYIYIYDIQVPSVRLLRWITDEWVCMYARNCCSSLLLALRPASRDAGAIKVAAQACFGVAGAQGFAQHTQTRSTKPRIIFSQSSELTVRRCTITPILCPQDLNVAVLQRCGRVVLAVHTSAGIITNPTAET